MDRPTFLVWGAAVALLLGALVLWIETGLGGRANLAVVDLANLAAAGSAALACWWRGRRETQRPRRGWMALGLACAFWCLGVAYVTYIDLWAQRGIPYADRFLPFPSWADVGFLGFIPFALAGVLLVPRGIFRSSLRVQNAIEGALVGVALLLVAWVTVLRDLGAQDLGGTWTTTLLLAYPYGDVALAAAAICAWEFVPAEERENLLFVVVGLGFLAMADLGFYVLVARDAVGISAINALWPAGFAVLALAAVRPTALAQPSTAREPVRALVPLSAAAGALAASFAFLDGHRDAMMATLAVLLAGAVASRWTLARWETTRARRQMRVEP